MSGTARIAYFDCFSGVSGDMCLGALIGAGWPAEELMAIPARLRLEDVRVQVGEARRGPFVARRVEVEIGPQQPHRHLHHIVAMLEAADLDAAVRAQAIAVFRRLAEAEAEVHGSTPEKVHFHEVGAADALVDVTGTIEGLRALGVSEVYSSPLRLGRGAVQSQHGLIPIPAPATALLLRGVPVEMPDIEAELVTPTGAALLTTLVRHWAAPAAFRLDRVGTGAGGRDLREQPNVLRVLIGERQTTPTATQMDGQVRRSRVAVLETAVDDDNPQFVAALIPRLLEHGALDAMVVPNLMKKGRPGLWMVAIADPARADEIAQMLLRETSSLGVRVRIDERYELERRIVEVATRFGVITLKVAELPGEGMRAVPEFESVRAAAERSGRPLREVSDAALAAWRAGAPGL